MSNLKIEDLAAVFASVANPPPPPDHRRYHLNPLSRNKSSRNARARQKPPRPITPMKPLGNGCSRKVETRTDADE